MKPLYDRVLVEPQAREEVTAGGVHLPAVAQTRPDRGTVVAVGPGRVGEGGKLLPCVVKPGDRVLYGAYAGTEVDLEGRKLQLMRETEILAVLPAKTPSRHSTPVACAQHSSHRPGTVVPAAGVYAQYLGGERLEDAQPLRLEQGDKFPPTLMSGARWVLVTYPKEETP